VRWTGGGAGRAAGIDAGGRLVVELPGGGRTALDAGEVHLGGVGAGPRPVRPRP
jgi:biotin-(acetyl-CoA carboxylase) ligase